MEFNGNLDFNNIANGLLVLIIGLLTFFGIRGGRKRPTGDVEVAGAMVDNSSVAKLAEAMRENTEAIEEGAREVHQHTNALREHAVEVRALREEMIRRR